MKETEARREKKETGVEESAVQGESEREGKKRVRCKMVGHPSSIEDTRDRDILRKLGQKPIVRHTVQEYSTIVTCHLPTPFSQSHP